MSSSCVCVCVSRQDIFLHKKITPNKLCVLFVNPVDFTEVLNDMWIFNKLLEIVEYAFKYQVIPGVIQPQRSSSLNMIWNTDRIRRLGPKILSGCRAILEQKRNYIHVQYIKARDIFVFNNRQRKATPSTEDSSFYTSQSAFWMDLKVAGLPSKPTFRCSERPRRKAFGKASQQQLPCTWTRKTSFVE